MQNLGFQTSSNCLWIPIKLCNVSNLAGHISNWTIRGLIFWQRNIYWREIQKDGKLCSVSKACNLHFSNNFWLDGAPPHYTNVAEQYFDNKLPNGWIGKERAVSVACSIFWLKAMKILSLGSYKRTMFCEPFESFTDQKAKRLHAIAIITYEKFKKCAKKSKADLCL